MILNDYINSSSFSTNKNELIWTKYESIFTYPELEKQLLENDFNIPNEVYTSSTLNAHLEKIDDDFLQQTVDNEYEQIIKNLIKHALCLEDKDYINKDTINEIIILECSLKSIFVLLSENCINECFEFFKQEINNSKNNNISIGSIENTFNTFEEYKSKVNVIRLKPLI